MTVFSRYKLRRFVRPALAVAGLLVSLGLVAPFVSAYAWSGHIRSALENSLGREVTFSDAHFTLFSGPGFTLTRVSIAEDPRFGLEAFAYVPTLQARLRLDELLRGHVVISSLSLQDPSLNIVRSADGRWNVVELVARLTAPGRLPIDLFPAFSVSNGRLDFKQGSRKTTLYVADSDLSLYPEHSGKLYIQFSGSPARTDRSASGFGHLRGTVNWYLKPPAANGNQIEADLTLDPSNISELSTLVNGHDAGVHGTVSSHARIEGPLANLRVAGNFRLGDVHRWDLMPSAGEDWRVAYRGAVDLRKHTVALETVPLHAGEVTPLTVKLRANDMTSQATWSVLASLNNVPAPDLLPFGKRMGLPVPDGLHLEGTADGVVTYSSTEGVSGGVELLHVSAALPSTASLRTEALTARLSRDGIRFENTQIQSDGSGSIEVGGEYHSNSRLMSVVFQPASFPVQAWRTTASDWFGAPDALAFLQDGTITGRIEYEHAETGKPQWSGQFRFADASLQPPGLSEPLTSASGSGRFDTSSLDVDHFESKLGTTAITGAYHLNAEARVPERFQIRIRDADLRDMQSAFAPLFQNEGWFARFGVTRRRLPEWLAQRHVQGELLMNQVSWNGTPLGSFRTSIIWNGPRITFVDTQLKMPDGVINGRGQLNLASGTPQYDLTGTVSDFRWRDGLLRAEGHLQTSGFGTRALENLRLDGTFTGQDVALSEKEIFSSVAGAFEGSFGDGWPDLRFTGVEASQLDESWTGTGASQSDGKLLFDLEHAGRQRHLVSSLESQTTPEPVTVAAPPSSR